MLAASALSVPAFPIFVHALERAILKAHDAGAELNIVGQGASVAVVLLALKRVEGMERGGVKVGANKVVLVGVDWAAGGGIAGVSAEEMARPGNVLELASVWVPKEGAMQSHQSARMRVYSETRKGEEFFIRDVWPEFGGSGASIEGLLILVKEAAAPGETLEKKIACQEAVLKEAEAKRAADEAALKEAQAREAQAEADRRAEAARLAALEAERKEAEVKKAAQAATARRAKAAALQWVRGPL